ncbi:DNA-processing protein DprA [Synechocystis sp. PCC 6714]|uniref:DNA-processing protein DprA n=1 Tax=Synechocystis sp. (strain PCC 6714) TaxID=1147 RepID=UPI0003FF93FE|nr:DNA-processing protein DprA [Synechocystis sp. PCC 6714]AIE76171.1 Rossmann fold nucleotide-binding protein Smf possibly involved in DNA uptake [Synechocystis sp. PCC 6714]
MQFTDNVLNILTAKTYRGIGKAWIVKNIKGNELIDELVNLLNQSIKEECTISVPEFEERKQIICRQFEKLRGVVDGVTAIGDLSFPLHRGVVKNSEKPIVLFYRGNLSLLEKQNKNVAVIGLLDPDKDTELFERKVVSTLVNHGVTILSGLALGCDSVAHQEALMSNGKTIAILPSPINSILPKSNEMLAEEIVKKNGLLISEYYEKANSKKQLNSRYVERNRLQALFSDCVILSASYAENSLGNDSGSRYAMNYALSYSIPRAIMYDFVLNANNSKYDLNRQLLKEDNTVIVISKDNMEESLKKILSVPSELPAKTWVQKNLFE